MVVAAFSAILKCTDSNSNLPEAIFSISNTSFTITNKLFADSVINLM